MTSTKPRGSCLCGAVSFEVNGELGDADACHCSQCRKWTGHYLASIGANLDEVAIEGADNLAWYDSSEKARRGFCRVCGASLFFDPIDKAKHDWIGISMGAFDTPLDRGLDRHIFVVEKGDYYELNDGLPQNEH